jgi:hypothetical protein
VLVGWNTPELYSHGQVCFRLAIGWVGELYMAMALLLGILADYEDSLLSQIRDQDDYNDNGWKLVAIKINDPPGFPESDHSLSAGISPLYYGGTTHTRYRRSSGNGHNHNYCFFPNNSDLYAPVM